jgi:predicted enzyme related to lactoylglutathione lyase
MPQVTSYAPGTPSWIDLSTTDAEGALAFYGTLFGWENDPQSMGPDAFYYMQRLRGLAVCGLYQQMEDQTSQGVPSHWTTYITVESADHAASRAEQAGGSILVAPCDVFEAGRMAMLQDPEGAVFAVWEPKAHIGCEVKSEPSALIWNEVMTNNPAEAGAFYGAVLGVEFTSAPMGYYLLRAGGSSVAGVLQITPQMHGTPPCWGVYFGVDDADAKTAQAVKLGATALVPPWDIPGEGRVAVLQDPQGAVFNLFQPVSGGTLLQSSS